MAAPPPPCRPVPGGAAGLDRRRLLQAAGALLPWSLPALSRGGSGGQRPNILWISAEDVSPDLGCYGDSYARTPALDRLAAEGIRFTRAFSHAPVCAPARSGIITGMYPTTIGSHHMRCHGTPPAPVRWREALPT